MAITHRGGLTASLVIVLSVARMAITLNKERVSLILDRVLLHRDKPGRKPMGIGCRSGVLAGG